MKAYIYCTQAKPYLISMGKDTKGVEMFQIIFDKKDWSKDEKYLNGSIVAECDVKEAFFLKDFDGVKYAENPIMHEHGGHLPRRGHRFVGGHLRPSNGEPHERKRSAGRL